MLQDWYRYELFMYFRCPDIIYSTILFFHWLLPGSRSRSKTAQDLSGLSGFPARFERFERFGRFRRFFLSGFWAVFPGRGPRLNVSLLCKTRTNTFIQGRPICSNFPKSAQKQHFWPALHVNNVTPPPPRPNLPPPPSPANVLPPPNVPPQRIQHPTNPPTNVPPPPNVDSYYLLKDYNYQYKANIFNGLLSADFPAQYFAHSRMSRRFILSRAGLKLKFFSRTVSIRTSNKPPPPTYPSQRTPQPTTKPPHV